MRDLISDAN